MTISAALFPCRYSHDYCRRYSVDRYGHRLTMIIGGLTAMIPCYLLLAFTRLDPIAFVVMIGLCFSLIPAALWPCIPLVVAPEVQLLVTSASSSSSFHSSSSRLPRCLERHMA